MSEYHEPVEELDDHVRDMHRALISLTEEIEAADWYAQRISRCADADLKRILEHNKNEETEHASMILEWLRRKSPEWDERLRQYLFTERPLGYEAEESELEASSNKGARRTGVGLGVGSLKRGTP